MMSEIITETIWQKYFYDNADLLNIVFLVEEEGCVGCGIKITRSDFSPEIEPRSRNSVSCIKYID